MKRFSLLDPHAKFPTLLKRRRREPANPRHFVLLNKALETGNVGDQRIIDDLRRLVSQNPKNTAAVRTPARAQVRAGKADDAVATLRQGIAADAVGDREQLSFQLQLAQTYADVNLG